jgi:phenylpyruvate tautomerase PptA (4-oxalocrotonate tautomerase family)
VPILDVEWLPTGDEPADLAQTIANAAARVFGSPPAGTWVRLWPLSPGAYAENGTATPPPAVFVHVLARRASIPDRERCATELAASLAACIGRPREHVHVIFEPDAEGRVYFGGKPDRRGGRDGAD